MNSVQITLFFKKDTIYKPAEFASRISEKFDELKEPIILPENKGFPEEANAPILLFINNKDFQIVSNFHTMVITVSNSEKEKLSAIMSELLKIVLELKIDIYRIGYVYKCALENDKISKFKSDNLVEEEIIDSVDFELSWLTNITINDILVNCWKRYFSSKEKNDKLNVIFDINTKADEENKITEEFVISFINESDNYISENIFN